MNASIKDPRRSAGSPPRLAILYPGDRAMRQRADPAESRFAALFAAFAAAGIHAEPAVWSDDFAEEVHTQLRSVQAVLVWCNPIEGGRTRHRLDSVLSRVAADGVFVSTHPDTIARLGTKDVLFDTRDLPFGSDVHRVESLAQLEVELPARLALGPRVLKQHRGHSGVGVWRVEAVGAGGAGEAGKAGKAGKAGEAIDAARPGQLKVRHAQRGSVEEVITLPALLERLAPYFSADAGGHMLDQAWQPRMAEGMVRAYLVADRVAGFGLQAINALHPREPVAGPRLYHGPELAAFQGLKRRLETEWVTRLRQRVGVAPERLPLLWDMDFMFGEPTAEEPERYVLCEVNVSSVSPFPPSAIPVLVSAVQRCLAGAAR